MNKPVRVSGPLEAVAAVLLALETLVTAVIAVGYLVYALVDRPFTGLSLALAGVAAVMAAGLGAFTWGFVTGRRFALGGAVTWQLMQASVGVWLFSVRPAIGAALVAAAVVVAVAVFRRQARLASPLAADERDA